MSFLYQCLHQLRELQGDLDPAESVLPEPVAGVVDTSVAAPGALRTPRSEPPTPAEFDLGTLGMHLGCDG